MLLLFEKADILLRGYSGWNSRRAIAVLNKVFPKSPPNSHWRTLWALANEILRLRSTSNSI
ncbi:hypothetical protein MUK42_33623 [Musa troglodytarum]|uniref:Uncharacterized protein n=1 Tax=Musa troglodytarum TaxID=320322 RepID=A0A9E7E7U8_9LILI|nr:hypothetical protein MUK42_33623 [Musa troglodytarum]